MGVYIKGMEMPSGCLSCDFCNPFTDEPYCRRLMRKTPKVTRLEDCPLVTVPPHGRLIDAQEQMRLMRSYEYDTYDDYSRAFDMLDNAPTIIEAEDGE